MQIQLEGFISVGTNDLKLHTSRCDSHSAFSVNRRITALAVLIPENGHHVGS